MLLLVTGCLKKENRRKLGNADALVTGYERKYLDNGTTPTQKSFTMLQIEIVSARKNTHSTKKDNFYN